MKPALGSLVILLSLLISKKGDYVAIVDANDDNTIADGKIQLKPASYVIIKTK